MKSNTNTELSILIPVKNEKEHMKILLKLLTAILNVKHEIFIIYDSPDDKSVVEVKKLQKSLKSVKLLRNKEAGVANAILTGVSASNGKYILILAADELGPLLAIDDMLELIKKGCDLVSCTRYAHGGRRLGGSLIQSSLSRLGNYIFHLLIRSSLSDSTTGIKMVNRNVFEKINLESRVGWAIVFELAIKAQMRGLKLGEVPIISIDRLYGGKSSFRIGPWFKEYLKWFTYGLINIRRSKAQKKVLTGNSGAI